MEFLERVRWTSGSPDTRINFYYEHQRSGADMQYRVKIVVEPITGAKYYGYTIVAVVSMDGSQKVEQTLKGNNPSQWSNNIEWTSPWYTINNKVSGTTSLAIRMKSNSGRDETYYYNMTVDPAYTSVTKWTVTSYTETSATVSWQTSDVCNQIRYGKSESSYSTLDVNSNSGSVTISGLSVGVANTLYFMPKRKDSNLWGNGAANAWKTTSVTTFNYPYVNTNTLPSFTIGQNFTINLYNPMNRSCTIYLLGNDNSTIITKTTTANGDIAITPSAEEITAMYQSIPSNRTGNYKVRLVCSELSRDTTVNGKTYSVVGNEIPTFEDFNYFDDNETTAELTGDNHKVVNGYSTVTVIVRNDQKAQANYYATMDKYEFQVGNSEKKEFPYTNLETSESITNVPNGAITVWAIDSRSLSKSVTKNAEEIPYVNIQKNAITVSRLNNIGEAVTLNYNGTFWNGDFGAENNAIVEAKYRYKKTTESWPEPAVWNGTTTITPTTTQGSNDFSFTGDIVGDITGVGFDEQYSYNIEVMISDKLSSTLFQVTLGSGRPNIAVDADGVAINGKYDDQDDSAFQVNGKTHLKGNTTVNGDIDITGNENVTGDIDITGNYKINGTALVIPTVNDATLTIQRNGTQVGTFTANSSSNKTINILTPIIYKGTISIVQTSGAEKAITATVPSGYSFLCWLQPATNGWLGNMYVENPFSQSSKLWCRDGFQYPGGVNCCYLCIKNNS